MALTQQEILEARKRLGIPAEGISAPVDSAAATVARRRQLAAEYDAQKQSERSFFSKAVDYAKDVGTEAIKSVKERAPDVVSTIKDANAGQITPGEAIIRVGGEVAGTLGDIIGKATEPVMQPVVEKIAETDIGKQALKALGQGIETWDEFKNQSPATKRFAEFIEGAVNIAEFLPAYAGAKVASTVLKTAKRGVGEFAETVAQKGKVVLKTQKEELFGKPFTDDILLQDAFEITKPVFDKRQSIVAFEKAGQPGGVTKKGTIGSFEAQPSQKMIDVANSVKDVVSKNNGPIDNIVNINERIAQISDNEIRPFLRSNPAPFNIRTLNARLKKIEPPEFIKADPVLQRTYDLVREKILKVVDKNKKTTEALWDSRKEFDAIAERQLGNLDPLSGQGNAIKQAVLDMRRAVNDFIADSVPNGDANFKAQLKRLSNMYEGRTNIAEQNYKLLDKNFIERWRKQNPQKARLLQQGLGLAGATAVGSAVFGN